MTPFRLALVGAGKITAGSHLPAALALPFVEIAAIVDPVAERARDAAAHFGRSLPHAARLEDVLGRIDGAVIATPNHTHHALARTCLEAGVPVLVEKPLTETVEDAEDLAALAAERGVALVTGYCTRFRESFAIVAEAVRGTMFGPLESFHHQDGSAGGWAPLDGYRGAPGGGGGVIAVTATHFLDRMTQWFGRPEILSYRDDSAGGPEANAIAEFRFPRHGGNLGRAHWSKTAKLGNATMIRFRDGVLKVPDGDVAPSYRAHGSAIVHTLAWPSAFAGFVGRTAFERQLEAFIATARGEQPPAVTVAEAVEQVRLVADLYAARTPLVQDWRAEPALQAAA
jgi:predicted dehydrogenase